MRLCASINETESRQTPPQAPQTALASHACPLDTSRKIPPNLNVRLPQDQSWLRIVFQCCPIMNVLCPAVSLPVTQASFPFIRWCSATMQQPDKIHSLQEWGGNLYHVLQRGKKKEGGRRKKKGLVFVLFTLWCLFRLLIAPHVH